MRVATIFDMAARPDTTGIYCQRALEALVETHHFEPAALATLPRQGFDFYLLVDDGLHYSVPADLRPLAWWAIDTHLDAQAWYPSMASQCDFVFTAQRDGASIWQARLRRPLCGSPWPAIQRSTASLTSTNPWILRLWGISLATRRIELLRLIQREFSNAWIGQAFLDEMARVYSAVRVVFNRSVRNDINMCVFEALACGSLLVTNALGENGLAELFQDGVHLVTYADADELRDKIRFYLSHETVRERIAAAGGAEALANHTYSERMQQILQVVEKVASHRAVSMPEERLQRTPQVSLQSSPEDELLKLIPQQAQRILHLGCGSGVLGRQLRVRQNAEVVGLERNFQTARLATKHLARVLAGDVTMLCKGLSRSCFDCIICDRVLENVSRPENLLLQLRELLLAGGVLIVRVRNIAHQANIQALLGGNWTYGLSHALEHNPVRALARNDVVSLLARAGFSVHNVTCCEAQDVTTISQLGTSADRSVMHGASAQQSVELKAHEFLITALAAPDSHGGDMAPGNAAQAMAIDCQQAVDVSSGQNYHTRHDQAAPDDLVLNWSRADASSPAAIGCLLLAEEEPADLIVPVLRAWNCA